MKKGVLTYCKIVKMCISNDVFAKAVL